MQRIAIVWIMGSASLCLADVCVDNTSVSSVDSPTAGSFDRPFRTIRYAISQAATNSKVYIKASTYNEYSLTFTGTKNLTLEGYRQAPGDGAEYPDAPQIATTDPMRAIYIAAPESTLVFRNLFFNPSSLLLNGGSVVQWASNANLTLERCQLGTPANSVIGIYGPTGHGVTRRLVVDRCLIYCRHYGIYVGCADLVRVENSRISSSTTINYAHVIQIAGIVGDPANQVLHTILRNNSIETTEASSGTIANAICGYLSDRARQFEVIGNNANIRSKGSLVAIPQNIACVRVEFNRCKSINAGETWTQINLGTDASPQVPPSNSLTKADRGHIIIRGNYLEQSGTIRPNPMINNGHGILIGQGVDFAEVSENIILGADNGIVVKGEGAYVHHNGVFGGVPCLLKGTQNSTICHNTFVSNQRPAGSGCLDIQDKSDGTLEPHPSGSSGNRITDNIFMVWYGFDDLCINDDPIGGFRPLSRDVKLNNNCYFAPSATVFSNLARQNRAGFEPHRAAWPAYSEMFADNDSTSLYKDPQLINPSAGDFRVRSASPVIGRGSIPGTSIGMWQAGLAPGIHGGAQP